MQLCTPSPAPGQPLAPEAGGAPPSGAAAAAALDVGKKCSAEELAALGHIVTKESPLPPGNGQKALQCLRLVLCKTSQGGRQTMLHCVAGSNAGKALPIAVGFYVGRGGPGTFETLAGSTGLDEGRKAFWWRWSRITAHKRDSAELANGAMVFLQDSEPSEGKPQLSTLDAIEKVLGNNVSLYGHSITRNGNDRSKVNVNPSATAVVWQPRQGPEQVDDKFSWETVGQWLPSMEESALGSSPKCTGLIRPVFEVVATKPPQQGASAVAWNVEPASGTKYNPLILLTCQKIELMPGQYVALSKSA